MLSNLDLLEFILCKLMIKKKYIYYIYIIIFITITLFICITHIYIKQYNHNLAKIFLIIKHETTITDMAK